MSSKVLPGDISELVTRLPWSPQSPTADERPTGPLLRGTPFVTAEHAQQVEREAYEKGVRDGATTAEQKHHIEVQPIIENLGRTLESFAQLEKRVTREREGDLIELSLAISRRVLHREVTLDPEAIRGLARVALERMEGRSVSRVRTHPSHREFIEPLLQQARSAGEVQIVGDPTLQPGDLIFESELGDLDASMDSQLDEIRRGLVDGRRE